MIIFVLYYITFSHKSKRMFSIQTTLFKCGPIFFLPQSIYKTDLGRVKVIRANSNRNRLIKLE